MGIRITKHFARETICKTKCDAGMKNLVSNFDISHFEGVKSLAVSGNALTFRGVHICVSHFEVHIGISGHLCYISEDVCTVEHSLHGIIFRITFIISFYQIVHCDPNTLFSGTQQRVEVWFV